MGPSLASSAARAAVAGLVAVGLGARWGWAQAPQAPAPRGSALAVRCPDVDIDEDALVAGLRARGVDLDGETSWAIDCTDDDHVIVSATSSRATIERTLELRAELAIDRARELAAALATLALELEGEGDLEPRGPAEPDAHAAGSEAGADPGEDDAGPLATAGAAPPKGRGSSSAGPDRRRRWSIGLGPQLELGSTTSRAAGGLTAAAGLVPTPSLRVELGLGWLSAADAGLRVHALDLGAGLAAGGFAVGQRLWIGASTRVSSRLWIFRAARQVTVPGVQLELGPVVRYEQGPWFIEARGGPRLLAPPVRAAGGDGRFEARVARGALAVAAGLRF